MEMIELKGVLTFVMGIFDVKARLVNGQPCIRSVLSGDSFTPPGPEFDPRRCLCVEYFSSHVIHA